MPNWCSVTVTVTGPEEALAKFRDAAQGHGPFEDPEGENPLPFSFNAIRPMPRELVEANQKDPKDDRWYSWALQNWGVKWEACGHQEAEELDEPEVLIYEFDTAWCGPDELILYASEQYPSLTFETVALEPCMGIHQRRLVVAGEVVEEEDLPIEYEDEDEEEEEAERD